MRTVALLALASLGCDVPIVAGFPIGPLSYRVDTADLGVPPELTDGATIASLPCPPAPATCPSAPEEGFASTCEGGVCDPVFEVTLDLPPVDLAEYGDLSNLGDSLSSAELRAVDYAVRESSLDLDLPECDLYWAPTSVEAFDADGDGAPDADVHPLGTVPPTPAGTTPNGALVPDAAGQRALSDHFLATPVSDLSFRMFLQTTVDPAPGDPLPQGALAIDVVITVRLEGSL